MFDAMFDHIPKIDVRTPADMEARENRERRNQG